MNALLMLEIANMQTKNNEDQQKVKIVKSPCFGKIELCWSGKNIQFSSSFVPLQICILTII